MESLGVLVFRNEYCKESLKDKFNRLVVNNPISHPVCLDLYEIIVAKFDKMSLEELHERVEQICSELD